MGEDPLVEFLELVFPSTRSRRRTLSIPRGGIVNSKLMNEVVRKLEEGFGEGARTGAVYFKQASDGSYEVRSYVLVDETAE